MSPVLTRSGLIMLGTGLAFIVAGAVIVAWPLIALGMIQISALLALYLLFLPTSVMLKRRYLEFAWWVPAGETTGGALVAQRPVALHLLLRNHAPFHLVIQRMEILCSSAITIDQPELSAIVSPRREVQLRVKATPRAAGYWFFHGLSVYARDRFGIFGLQVYYPNLMGIKVFPRLGIGREPIPFRPRTGAFHERIGQRMVRQIGLGSDLREIREHIPGDPFKRIAWKATARMRKLMVRELESEIVVTHWILLDISSTMRDRPPGYSKLDYGLSLCAAFARLALEAGDRVGLITFDHRIYSKVKPSDGNPQLYRIIDRLMELHNIVDEDLTDLTDPELYTAIADYLSYQQGIDVQHRHRPPAAGDPMWGHLVLGPHGEIYNIQAMERAVIKSMQKEMTGVARWRGKVKASNPRSAQLRRFCRQCGLEIPYRQHSFIDGKEKGMTEAIHQSGTSRQSQFIVLITDLEEISDLQIVTEALQLARRRHHSLSVVAPFSPDFTETPEDQHHRRVQQIISLRAKRQRKNMRQAIERLGIPVLSASPEDTLHRLLRRLARIRLLRTGTSE